MGSDYYVRSKYYTLSCCYINVICVFGQALSTSPNFKPKEKDGKFVDVEKVFTESIDKQESQLSKKFEDDSRMYAEKYFQLLAQRFGMNADIQFIEG